MERIDGYILEGVLGEGSTSVVYRAYDRTGCRVAIKLLREEAVNEEVQRRFLRESQVRIDHPNVAQVLGAAVTSTGTPYIVLELLEGASFDVSLTGRPISARDALHVVRQAARGIAAAHRIGVVHRDLKPANIFCCHDGTVKVLDFGVARAADLGTMATRAGQLLGTVLYFAPEQLAGGKSADARSDVWALGMVLYHALAGQPAFARSTAIATAMAIATEPVPPLPPRTPAPLVSVVEYCLRKKPDERLPNALALCAALEIVRL